MRPLRGLVSYMAGFVAWRQSARIQQVAGSTPFDLADLLAANARLRSLPDRRPWWRDRTLLQYDGFRWGVSLEWKLADLWIGAFFKNRELPGHVWTAIYRDGLCAILDGRCLPTTQHSGLCPRWRYTG